MSAAVPLTEELKELFALKQAGALTEDEFGKAKAQAIARGEASAEGMDVPLVVDVSLLYGIEGLPSRRPALAY